jgi:oligopeptide transport system substrate-binding protein
VPVSGAFELAYWRMNDRIRLKRNHRYWDAENTRSEIIDLLPCTSASTALNLYESGAVDVVWDRELAPPALLDILRQRPDFHVFDYLGTYFFRFNVTKPPFNDSRVRKALALAVDKDRIVERITNMGEKPSSHLVPPGIPGYEPPAGLGYDPEQARQLLAEAGFPGGKGFPRVQYLYNTQATHEKIAVEMQEMWRRDLGINIELRSMEFKVFLPAQSNLEFDMSRSSWFGDYNDANTFLDLFLSNNPNNRTGWKHERYDELIRSANAELDAEKRVQLLQEAEIILVREEVPIVPLFIYVGLQYYDAGKVKGIHQNLLGEHPFRAIYKVGNSPRDRLEAKGGLSHPFAQWRADD